MTKGPIDMMAASGPLISSGDTGPAPARGGGMKLVEVRIDNYLVTVALDSRDRFCGIAKIAAAGDFLTPMQRLASARYQDVSKFYEDEAR